jgi:transcriptional regulator of met regulon
MDELTNSRFGLITYKPQISYPSLTDDFLTIILPKLKQKCNFFLWAVEDDDTPMRHIHIFLKLNKNEEKKQKIKQNYLDFKAMKDFLSHSIKHCEGNSHQIDHPLLTQDLHHHMDRLGYCMKQNPRRWGCEGISDEIITQCVKLHHANEKVKPTTEEDWDLLTPKNVYTKLPHIFKTKNIDPYGHDFLYHCSINNIGLANISVKQLKIAYTQLKIKSIYKDEEKKHNLSNLKESLNQEMDWEDFEHKNFQNTDTQMLNEKNSELSVAQKKIDDMKKRIISLESGNIHYRSKIQELEKIIKDNGL